MRSGCVIGQSASPQWTNRALRTRDLYRAASTQPCRGVSERKGTLMLVRIVICQSASPRCGTGYPTREHFAQERPLMSLHAPSRLPAHPSLVACPLDQPWLLPTPLPWEQWDTALRALYEHLLHLCKGNAHTARVCTAGDRGRTPEN